MDNGLFELQAATASPPRDAATDRARRDRNDDDFGTLVRASDARADRAASETSAAPDHRDPRSDDRQDRATHYSDTARNNSEPSRHEDQPNPSVGRSFEDHASAETPTTFDDGVQPAQDGLERALTAIDPLTDAVVVSPSPSTPTTVAAGVLDALLAGGSTPVVATPAHATALDAAQGAGQAGHGGAASSSGANVALPNGDAHPAPNRPSALPAGVMPANGAGPAQPPLQLSTNAAPPQTNALTEAPADTPDTSAGSATSERPEVGSGLQNAETQVQSAATLAAMVNQSPVDAPEVAAASALAATAAHRQSTNADGAQPIDADTAADPTVPNPALAANANAAANNRPTANRPASANAATSGQQRSGIANKPGDTPAGPQNGASAATTNDHASAVRDAALAIATDRLAPGHALRLGDAAPDLAVFRETLANVLPETAGAQMTDSIRAAGRIAAADLGNRPQMMHPSLTDQVTIRIREAFDAGDSQIRIQLQPKELGRIDVRMDFHESGRMTAHVVAERADTLELLMRDARGLERALQQAGFDTDSNSLAFDLKEQDQQSGSQDDDGAGGELVADDSETSDEINIDLAALMQGDTSTSGVDIQV